MSRLLTISAPPENQLTEDITAVLLDETDEGIRVVGALRDYRYAAKELGLGYESNGGKDAPVLVGYLSASYLETLPTTLNDGRE